MKYIFILVCGSLALLLVAGCSILPDTKPENGLILVLQVEPLSGDRPVGDAQLQMVHKVLEERARAIGAVQPSAEVEGSDHILLTLPGITNLESAAVITKPGFLEFIDTGSQPLEEGEIVTTTLGGPSADQLQEDTIAQTLSSSRDEVWEVVVTSEDMDRSKTEVKTNSTGIPVVSFTFTGAGQKKLADFTSKNVANYMPIVLDKKVISSPVIQGAITEGSGEISGLTLYEANELAVQLKSDSLPVRLTLIESRQMSGTPTP